MSVTNFSLVDDLAREGKTKMNPNEGLEKLLEQFSAQIKATPENSKAVLSLFRNWVVPILTDFGVAINQTAFGLHSVAEAVNDVQDLTTRTLQGQDLMLCADTASDLKTALAANDIAKANELCDSLLDILSSWSDVDDVDSEPEPEPEPEPKPEPEPESEPEPVSTGGKYAKKRAVKTKNTDVEEAS